MAKIALIRPPSALPRFAYTAVVSVPPMGMAYVAAALEADGHEVLPIDSVGEGLGQYTLIEDWSYVAHGLTHEEICDRIPADVELIGFSIMFSNDWFYSSHLIKRVKARFPGVPIVVGGEHATADWESIMRSAPAVDFCILGEGEETIRELAASLASGVSSLSQVAGVAYRSSGTPVANMRRSRVKEVDALRRPLWEKFPVEKYLEKGYNLHSIGGIRTMPILASRGCPFTCTFCSCPQMWGTDLRMRDPEDVVDEIKHYVRRYKIEHVDFYDLVGVINKQWTTRLLEILERENLDVTWMLAAGTRSEILTPEMLALFKRAKVMRLLVAPETGSKETTKRIKKRADPDKILSVIKTANRLGIPSRANIIIGFPGQTLSEFVETMIYTVKLTLAGIDDIVINAFTAYPGSELSKDLQRAGRIPVARSENDEEYLRFLASLVCTKFWGQRSWSEHIPHWAIPPLQLGTMALNCALQFTVRPHRLFISFYRALILRKPLTFFENFVLKTALWLESLVRTGTGRPTKRIRLGNQQVLTLDQNLDASERPARAI